LQFGQRESIRQQFEPDICVIQLVPNSLVGILRNPPVVESQRR
jgi:hypothetical protein